MKIAILGATNIKHMSLISHYLDHINLNENEIDVIYTDKYAINETIDGISNYYKYYVEIKPEWSFVKKALKYYKFKSFAYNILRKNKYDFILVWGSYTAHLFKNILIKYYKDRYILNVRDYFHENNKYIYARMAQIINFSAVTTLSSEGFKKFLPKSDKYEVIYSFNSRIIKKSIENKNLKPKFPIRISFIGNVRFFEINKKILKSLANDKRFVIQYFGTDSNVLKIFAQENNIKNVAFKGGFDIDETPCLLNNTDIINNLFGESDIALETALSIRMYYSLFLNKPLLTSQGTFTAEQATDFGLGIEVKDEDLNDLASYILQYYKNLNEKEVYKKRKCYIEKVKEQNEYFYKKLSEIFND